MEEEPKQQDDEDENAPLSPSTSPVRVKIGALSPKTRLEGSVDTREAEGAETQLVDLTVEQARVGIGSDDRGSGMHARTVREWGGSGFFLIGKAHPPSLYTMA